MKAPADFGTCDLQISRRNLNPLRFSSVLDINNVKEIMYILK